MIIIASNNLEKSVEITDFLNILKIESKNYQKLMPKISFPKEGTQSLIDNVVDKCTFLKELLPTENILADDTGLFMPSYPDLFGVQTKRDFESKGFLTSETQNNYVIELCKQANDYRVEMHVAICLNYENKQYVDFVKVPYIISPQAKGNYSSGFDRILSVNGVTLAEMPLSERFQYAHRAIALKKIKNSFFS